MGSWRGAAATPWTLRRRLSAASCSKMIANRRRVATCRHPEPLVLRRLVRKLLLELSGAVEGETWAQWAERAKALCDKIAADCGITSHKQRLGGAFKANAGDKPDELRALAVAQPPAWPAGLTLEVLTIHEAKGREFDAIIFYCPRPSKAGGTSTCPSAEWWHPVGTSEEREVAFVAATRAKHLLMLAVHEATWTALNEARQDFVALFEPLAE